MVFLKKRDQGSVNKLCRTQKFNSRWLR